MGFLTDRIQKIEGLLAEGSGASLTYAALECRLAIEFLCYDRLRVSHDYISHDDLYKWQPKDVVKILINDVYGGLASKIVLSVSKSPLDDSRSYDSPESYKDIEFVDVGTQSRFDPIQLGKVWNSISSFLHTSLPKSKSDSISHYGPVDKIRKKIEDAISLLKDVDTGTMILSGMGEEVHFDCVCGTTNKRRSELLSYNQVINCINANCDEKYNVHIKDNKFEFERRFFKIPCNHCGHINTVSESPLIKMSYTQQR